MYKEVKKVSILGTRGIPASHGGFETFAEKLALYLSERDWNVVVYCEKYSGGRSTTEWHGITLHHFPVKSDGPIGTIVFDFKSIWHALNSEGAVLTLGYNTAIFNLLFRLRGVKNVINMDGIEWKRSKWSKPVQWWFYFNELIGCVVGNRLIADNPEIKNHLARWGVREKTTMIPYGADEVLSGDPEVLRKYGLEANRYAIVVARPEPENSILEMVKAFSRQRRGINLVVLGNYNSQHSYQAAVRAASSEEVIFPGAIYDAEAVKSLRYYARFYLHGHQVGGTNPSLVEAMGAGNAVLARDNRFNRWVVGEGALYFNSIDTCVTSIERLVADDALVDQLGAAARKRFVQEFTWDKILPQYERLLAQWQPDSTRGVTEKSASKHL